MALIDHPGEWLRLTDHYRGMTDGELLNIAGERGQLTELAQQILALELSARRLKIKDASPQQQRFPDDRHQTVHHRSTTPVPTSGHDQSDVEVAADPYAEDRTLVPLLTVWSLRDAMQVQRALDVASIPFCMGAENATGVETVTSNFATGVDVKIMRIGLPWAWTALRYYDPQDEPKSEREHWDEEVDVRCPKCRATEIVFNGEVASSDGPARRYKWTCGVCGNKWEDDGVAARRTR